MARVNNNLFNLGMGDIGRASALQTGTDLDFITQMNILNQRQENNTIAKETQAGNKARAAQNKSIAMSERERNSAGAGVSNLNSVRIFNLGL